MEEWTRIVNRHTSDISKEHPRSSEHSQMELVSRIFRTFIGCPESSLFKPRSLLPLPQSDPFLNTAAGAASVYLQKKQTLAFIRLLFIPI
jgi:hypothetical protein